MVVPGPPRAESRELLAAGGGGIVGAVCRSRGAYLLEGGSRGVSRAEGSEIRVAARLPQAFNRPMREPWNEILVQLGNLYRLVGWTILFLVIVLLVFVAPSVGGRIVCGIVALLIVLRGVYRLFRANGSRFLPDLFK